MAPLEACADGSASAQQCRGSVVSVVGVSASPPSRPSSSGRDLAVLDGVRAWAAVAGVVIAAGREGRAFGRQRIRIVAVNEVITGAAGDHVAAVVSVQRVVVGT